MRKICIPNTNLNISRFVFGTASLHRLGRKSLQASHLEAALTAGFTHFDTAPLYGFGGAERVLGDVVSNMPGITLTTKVGLYPPGGSDQRYSSMLARKFCGKLFPTMSKAIVNLSVEQAKRSLDHSLKRLSRQYIDILLLHEPLPHLMLTDEWLRWQESEADRIGYMGMAGPAKIIEPFLTLNPSLSQVIQVRDGLDTKEGNVVTNTNRPLQFTYGYFSSENSGRRGEEVLKGALTRNNTGAIIVYTSSLTRLKKFRSIEDQVS